MKIIYNICDYGAKQSTTELQTAFIQKAIDACAKNGGGEVVIPAGSYLTGSLYMRSHVKLHLMEDSILLGSKNPDDYVDYPSMQTLKYECLCADPLPIERDLRRNRAIISAFGEEDLTIIGEKGAMISGQNCFDPLGQEDMRGPRGILYMDCENIQFSGFTFIDSANNSIVMVGCKNIVAHEVDFEGGQDGFLFWFSTNVLVENCKIICGDDCFCIAFTKNIVIRNCELNTSCNLFRAGGCDLLLDNCHCQGPAVYGHRMTISREDMINGASSKGKGRRNICAALLYFSYEARDPSIAVPHRNMVMQNCTFDYVDSLVTFHYGENMHQTFENLESLTIRNCVCTNVNYRSTIRSDKENATVFRMEDVHLSARPGFENEPFLVVENCKEITLHNVTLEGFNENKLVSLGGKPNLTALGCDEFKIVEE